MLIGLRLLEGLNMVARPADTRLYDRAPVPEPRLGPEQGERQLVRVCAQTG
jgi:hypothetical protein